MEIVEVPGFPGYFADRLGSVYRGDKRMKGFTTPKGYKAVKANVDGRQVHLSAHRAVGLAFIPNPENLPQINHKNGIKADNRIENLEWVTGSENVLHAYAMGMNINIKPVISTDMKTGEEIRYASACEATRLDGFHGPNIAQCCLGRRPYHKGRTWRYAEP